MEQRFFCFNTSRTVQLQPTGLGGVLGVVCPVIPLSGPKKCRNVFAALTDRQMLNARTKPNTYKLFDGGGLYLEVSPGGSKLW